MTEEEDIYDLVMHYRKENPETKSTTNPMKLFKVAEIKKMYGWYSAEQISFSRMVELMNEKANKIMFENVELKVSLQKSNEILRSCYDVIKRQGKETNWEALESKVLSALKDQQLILNNQNG